MKSLYTILLLLSFTFSPLWAQTDKDTLPENNTFELGEVLLYAKNTKDKITHQELIQFNKTDVAQSLNLLPSVSINAVGSRNESAVYVRGFDIRSVPIYIDGVPVYVPYDGYVDLSRFTTADLSKIEVSKGYSSILYGPNAIGGTINMISTQPENRFELKTKVGLLSGNGFNNYASIGTKQEKFYLQTVFTQFDRDFIPLPKDFETSTKEPDLKRDNSYRKDRKFTAKAGFTPNATDEYVVSYSSQSGEKGNPIYLGNDPNTRVRYWQWPYWDKESLYFISKTQLGTKTYLKSRIFSDNFKNKLMAFDDATYSTQTRASSFTSYYNDKTYGGNLETGTEFTHHTLKAALHYKRDYHQSYNEGENPEHLKDDTYSLGIEDVYDFENQLKVIPGISYNIRKSIEAENVKITNPDGSYGSFPQNTNTALNAQLAAYYPVNERLEVNTTLSYKTRFATMKDRYSYKLGTALPNPDLQSEEALNWEIGSDYKIQKFTVKPAIFYSKIYNTIQSVSNVEPGVSQMQNTGKSQFYGADLSLAYQPVAKLDLLLNYTFIKRKNLSNPDLLFTDVPENHVFAFAKWNPFTGFNANVNAEYGSKRYSTSYGVESPDYFVLNSQISHDLKNGIRVETGINNIFDKNYTLTEGYPEEGRNYYFSLYYQFSSK